MHNTPLKNAGFELTFAETNLRWLLGEESPNVAKVKKGRAIIAKLKQKIQKLLKKN